MSINSTGGVPPSTHSATITIPQGAASVPNPKIAHVAHTTFAAHNTHHSKKSCCANFWTFLHCFAFPLSWIIERIVAGVTSIFSPCGKPNRAGVSPPVPPAVLSSSVRNPVRNPSGSSFALPPIPPHSDDEALARSLLAPDSDLDSPSDDDTFTRTSNTNYSLTRTTKVDPTKKLVDAGIGLINFRGALEKQLVENTQLMDLLQTRQKPDGSPAPGLTLEQFFTIMKHAHNNIASIKHQLNLNEQGFKNHLAELAKFKRDGLTAAQSSSLEASAAKVNVSLAATVKSNALFESLFKRWEGFVSGNKAALIERFKSFQDKLRQETDALVVSKGVQDPKNPVVGFLEYPSLYNFMHGLGMALPDHPDHVLLLNNRLLLADSIGFSNPTASYCWRNAAIQSLRGIDQIDNLIRTLQAPPRLFIETEEAFQKRLANLKPLEPIKTAETPEAFEQRLKEFENKYPVPRTAAIEKMLFDARVAAKFVTAPVLREPETDAEFQLRLAAHKIADKKSALTKEAHDSLRPEVKKVRLEQIPKKLKAHVDAYHKAAFVNKGVLAPFPAESQAAFDLRNATYQQSRVRAMESDHTLALKQEVLNALKSVWSALDYDQSLLDAALDQLHEAIFNGVSPEFDPTPTKRNPNPKKAQLDSGALVSVIIDVLGMSNQLLEHKQTNDPTKDVKKVTASQITLFPLVDAYGAHDDMAGLIKQWSTDVPYDPNNPLNGVTSYTSKYRYLNDPQPVMAFQLNRNFIGDQQKITKAVNDMQHHLIQQMTLALGHTPSQHKIEKAISKFAEEVAQPDKFEKEINFATDMVLDVSSMFEDVIVAKAGGKISYRVRGFTRHIGPFGHGHYIGCRVNKTGQWREYNDNTVTPKSDSEIQDQIKQAFVIIGELVK